MHMLLLLSSSSSRDLCQRTCLKLGLTTTWCHSSPFIFFQFHTKDHIIVCRTFQGVYLFVRYPPQNSRLCSVALKVKFFSRITKQWRMSYISLFGELTVRIQTDTCYFEYNIKLNSLIPMVSPINQSLMRKTILTVCGSVAPLSTSLGVKYFRPKTASKGSLFI